jgi:hypothetical protein
MPESGFKDDFAGGLARSIGTGFSPAKDGRGLVSSGSGVAFAYTSQVCINKAVTGCEWRT